MEYFKCHWCGSTLNNYKPLCPNCGGSLDHQSAIKKSRITNPEPHENELSRTVKKISGMLVLICLIIVSVPLYYLFDKGSQNSDEVSVETGVKNNTALAPISKLSSGHEQGSLQLHRNSDDLSKKLNSCVLDFDKSITPKVYVVSSYRGLQTSEVQFGRSGHEVRESDVVVNKPGEKIILVLMAYDPVIWKIQKTFDSNVTGVILAGYHDQVITGLPKTTPILEAIYEKQTSCKYFYKNIKEGGHKHYIEKRIESIVGSRPYEYITSAYNGKFYIGNTSPKSPLMQYSDITYQTELKQQIKEKGYSIDKIAAKEEGIIQLINQGKLRVASVSDIDNWSIIASRHSNGGTHRMRLGFTYVILGKMQFPRGMFGAHSKSFILKKNVPVPTGKMGHNTIYLMNDGTCMGTVCFR